jgi:RNA polymerase sigma-70 factor (sigma-E family)
MHFEEFASARLPALLRYGYLLCGDRELARDMVQEVLIRTLINWDRVVAADEPSAYVRAMLTNEYLSFRRRRSVRQVALTYETADLAAEPDPARSIEERTVLWHRLGRLPRQQRAVLVLRYYEGLNDAEIADVLGCRQSTVRGYATRALAALRVEIAAEPLADSIIGERR